MRIVHLTPLGALVLGLSTDALTAQMVQEIEIAEWEVPWENSRPRDPYVAPDGKVWFVGQRSHYAAWLDRETGEFKRFPLDEGAGLHNLIVDDDGTVFYAETGCSISASSTRRPVILRSSGCPTRRPAIHTPWSSAGTTTCGSRSRAATSSDISPAGPATYTS